MDHGAHRIAPPATRRTAGAQVGKKPRLWPITRAVGLAAQCSGCCAGADRKNNSTVVGTRYCTNAHASKVRAFCNIFLRFCGESALLAALTSIKLQNRFYVPDNGLLQRHLQALYYSTTKVPVVLRSEDCVAHHGRALKQLLPCTRCGSAIDRRLFPS